MKFMCEFVGGRWNGRKVELEEAVKYATGKTEDLSKVRKNGGFCRRVELDNKPTFDGYLSPMWDGLRYCGMYEFEVSERIKRSVEPVAILRYETQEVYNMMSN